MMRVDMPTPRGCQSPVHVREVYGRLKYIHPFCRKLPEIFGSFLLDMYGSALYVWNEGANAPDLTGARGLIQQLP